jgi:hypothetical protein
VVAWDTFPMKKTKKVATKTKRIEYIGYSEADRHEFITGFHSRKVAYKKARVSKAIAKEKDIMRSHRSTKHAKLSQMNDQIDIIDNVKILSTETVQISQIDNNSTVVTISEFDPNEIY